MRRLSLGDCLSARAQPHMLFFSTTKCLYYNAWGRRASRLEIPQGIGNRPMHVQESLCFVTI